jgi:hypothetical protein
MTPLPVAVNPKYWSASPYPLCLLNIPQEQLHIIIAYQIHIIKKKILSPGLMPTLFSAFLDNSKELQI